jgi:hypothetical protein
VIAITIPALRHSIEDRMPNGAGINALTKLHGKNYDLDYAFSAQLDYGIPFNAIDTNKRTGQEKGFYFSLNYNRSF